MIAPKSYQRKPKKSGKPTRKHQEDEEEEQEENKPQGLADMVATFSKYADKLGIVMSVMSEQYEGGDFCSGLTVAFELKSIGLEVAGNMFKNMLNPKDSGAEF